MFINTSESACKHCTSPPPHVSPDCTDNCRRRSTGWTVVVVALFDDVADVPPPGTTITGDGGEGVLPTTTGDDGVVAVTGVGATFGIAVGKPTEAVLVAVAVGVAVTRFAGATDVTGTETATNTPPTDPLATITP